MEKIKLHELAKKLNLNSKDLIEKAKSLGIDVKSHLSTITEEEAKKLEKSFVKETKTKENKEVKKEKVQENPVIIRRAVIINDDEPEKKERKDNGKSNKRNDIGFIENNRNKDYNIVYRNKPNKPMTVSELFGLKKEEPKKNEEIQN